MSTTKKKYRVSVKVTVETGEGSPPLAHHPVHILEAALRELHDYKYETDDGVVSFDYQVSNIVEPLEDSAPISGEGGDRAS